MTEEKARPKYTSPGASQPNKKPDSQKNLTDKVSDLPTDTLRFQQTQEQKTMAEATTPTTPKNPEDAKKEFDRIKKALIGPTPEWCLPTINPKAQASIPRIDNSVVAQLKASCSEVVDDT
jgi:uncharacterized protein (DUF4415 family)